MSDSQPREIMSSWGQFGVDLYYASIRRLNDKRSNIAVSPYSVGMACLMLGLGSQGQTRHQTMQALRCNLQDNVEASDDALAKLAAALLAAVPRSPEEEVSTCFDVANRIFCQEGYPFLASYLDRLRQSCSAGVDYIDYAARADDARKRMNAWVAETTQHRVTDLFQQGSVTADTRLVLANAVYFKGLWAEKFDEQATRVEPFHVEPGIAVEIPTMSLCAALRNGYFDEGKARTLAIPYAGNSFAMLLLLPDSLEGLGVLEEAVRGRDVARLLREMRQDEVNLQLPRFRMEGEVPLTEVLQEMGMVDVFLPGQADLSGMDGRRQLYVSDARHKAVLEVDEKGSEAAAASSVAVAEFAALEDPVQFIADHPFMVAIVHQATGCMLFLGRVIDPSY